MEKGAVVSGFDAKSPEIVRPAKGHKAALVTEYETHVAIELSDCAPNSVSHVDLFKASAPENRLRDVKGALASIAQNGRLMISGLKFVPRS